MPVGEDQYLAYLKRAREPIESESYFRLCWEEVLPEESRVCRDHKKEGFDRPVEGCTRCARYEENMIRKTISNLIGWGFLKRSKDPNLGKTFIEVTPDTGQYVDGMLEGGFSELVLLSLENAWRKPKSDQVALEAFLDVMNKIPKESKAPLSQKQLREELGMETNPIRGYDFNIKSYGSARTLRELLKLMEFLGIIEMDDRGRCRLTPDKRRIKEVKRKLRYLSLLNTAEDAVDALGPSHGAMSDRFIMALSKYYIYRHCKGIGKQRALVSILAREIEKTHTLLLKDHYDREAKRIGRGVGRGKTLANTAKNYRKMKAGLIADRLKMPKDSKEYKALVRLSVSSLDRLESCETVDELRVAIRRAKGRFDRSILDETRHSEGLFVLPKGFEFFSNWQREAVDDWMRDIPSMNHDKLTGIVSAVTGSGKTVMAMLAIQDYLKENSGTRVSIVVPTKVLMYQWAMELARLLGLSSTEIGLRGDGFKDSFSKGKRVVVSIVNSAIREGNLKMDVKTLPEDARHLLIADECHRYGGGEFRKVFECRTDAHLGLSATPPAEDSSPNRSAQRGSSDSESEAIASALGRSFFHLNYQRARDDGLICEFKIRFIGVHLTQDERLQYDQLTKAIGKALEKIRLRYGHRIDAMRGQSLEQKLQTILKSDDYPDRSIGRYFRLTRERRDVIYESVNRKTCYLMLLRKGIERERKMMIFHEKISQLEAVVAPVNRRHDRVLDTKEREANKSLQNLLMFARFRPVMYHSLQDPKWNKWSMEWFRHGVANAMISVKALVEGVDVPSADVGIIRVSSSSVRQRIQTVGRILRRRKERSAEIDILFVTNTVDTNIFKAYDWETELGQAAIEFWEWDDVREELLPRELDDLPIPEDYDDTRPPLDVDTSELKPGDIYPGRYAGDLYHVDANGKPYKRTRLGRVFLQNAEIVGAGGLMKQLKGGGKLLVTPQGNLVTKLGKNQIVFLGTADPDALRNEVSKRIEDSKKRLKRRGRAKGAATFEELFRRKE
jgi:superfamily II DNA or RNA helicase